MTKIKIPSFKSDFFSTKPSLIISAAAEGVGALKSETKSHIVKSVSWPIALIVGMFNLKISLANFSELNDHRSSKEPPPRAKIMISRLFNRCNSSIFKIALRRLSSEPSP